LQWIEQRKWKTRLDRGVCFLSLVRVGSGGKIFCLGCSAPFYSVHMSRGPLR